MIFSYYNHLVIKYYFLWYLFYFFLTWHGIPYLFIIFYLFFIKFDNLIWDLIFFNHAGLGETIGTWVRTGSLAHVEGLFGAECSFRARARGLTTWRPRSSPIFCRCSFYPVKPRDQEKSGMGDSSKFHRAFAEKHGHGTKHDTTRVGAKHSDLLPIETSTGRNLIHSIILFKRKAGAFILIFLSYFWKPCHLIHFLTCFCHGFSLVLVVKVGECYYSKELLIRPLLHA